LAKKLRRSQDYVRDVETGQKIVGVVELMEWAEAVGFDARAAIKALEREIVGSCWARRKRESSPSKGSLKSSIHERTPTLSLIDRDQGKAHMSLTSSEDRV
jgi:hypothetical protein